MSGSDLLVWIPRNETARPFISKNYNVLSPNFQIHVSVSNLYIPRIGLPILLSVYLWTIHDLCIPRVQNKCQVPIYEYEFPEMKLHGLVISKTELYCSVSQYPNSCICEQFIYFQDWSAYFAAAEKADRSWEYENRSKIHEFRNWDRGRAVSFLGRHKLDFRYSV